MYTTRYYKMCVLDYHTHLLSFLPLILDPHEITVLQTTMEEQKIIADDVKNKAVDENAHLGADNWNCTACMYLILLIPSNNNF